MAAPYRTSKTPLETGYEVQPIELQALVLSGGILPLDTGAPSPPQESSDGRPSASNSRARAGNHGLYGYLVVSDEAWTGVTESGLGHRLS